MKDLGIAVVAIMWATILVGAFNWAVNFVRDRRVAKYEQGPKRIPILFVQNTFRKATR